MILADTSVWVNHLRATDPILVSLLDDNQVVMHPMVIGCQFLRIMGCRLIRLRPSHPVGVPPELCHRPAAGLTADAGESSRANVAAMTGHRNCLKPITPFVVAAASPPGREREPSCGQGAHNVNAVRLPGHPLSLWPIG